MDKDIPDLSALSANHGGTYLHGDVVSTIYGTSRNAAHGSLDMPDWGNQLMYVGRGWHSSRKRKLANDRIQTLADYVEILQAN